MRTLSKDIASQASKSVTVQGWLHKKRDIGGVMFLIVRDRAGLVQVVVHDTKEQTKLDGLQIGTVLEIAGTVKSDERAMGGAEIHEPKLSVLVPVTSVPPIEFNKPIDHTPDNLDTLFENRVYNLRNPNEQLIFRIRAAMVGYIREFLSQQDFVEIHTPKLLAGATEGGAEAFKLDYFDQEATLAQSPQLYKQILVGAFERVFEIAPAFRAEPSLTTRHMSEVYMLDIEMGFIKDHSEVMDMVQDLTYEALSRTYKQFASELELLKAPPLTLKPKFPRYTVAQVHELYSKATGEDVTKEKDLLPAEERWICNYSKENDGCEAVFVTDFPIEAMKFYHMINPEDPKTVLWGDLLFRGLEIATCPQREHDHKKLTAQIEQAGLDPKHPGYKYYLQAFEAGLPPHGGCGYGIDRLVQKTVGLNNIKEATLFPRDMNRLAP